MMLKQAFLRLLLSCDRIKKLSPLRLLMKSVIIAEDDEKVRETYARAVKRFSGGAEVHEVGDGETLVEKVRERDYDLIFTDNDMPRMSGLFAIVNIREFNPHIPICMMSGDKFEEIMPEAMKAGATDYIDKGDYEHFTEKLKGVVNKYL